MDLDDTLIALADDTRRSILRRLASGEARVTEIAAPFDISLNSVSKHIRLLERAGLVRPPRPPRSGAARRRRDRKGFEIPIPIEKETQMTASVTLVEPGTVRLERLLPGPVE